MNVLVRGLALTCTLALSCVLPPGAESHCVDDHDSYSACAEAARATDQACVAACTEPLGADRWVTACAVGECEARCARDSSEALTACADGCSDAAADRAEVHACWTACLDDSVACYVSDSCPIYGAADCDWDRFVCTLGCDESICFSHSIEIGTNPSCPNYDLPGPPPAQSVDSIVVWPEDGGQLNQIPPDECGSRVGWVWADQDTIRLCGVDCWDLESGSIRVDFGCSGDLSPNDRP